MEESRGSHLADAIVKLAALKYSQPTMEIPMLLAEVTGDLKDNIMEAQHLAIPQNRKKW